MSSVSVNERIKNEIFSAENREVFWTEEFCTKEDREFEGGRLVYDGVINEGADSVVVFLLKDSVESGIQKDYENNRDLNPGVFDESETEERKKPWDLAATTKTEAEQQIENYGKKDSFKHWPSICYWMEALKTNPPSYNEIDENKDCRENLLDVAIINIKKTSGKGSSDDKILDRITDKENNVLAKKYCDIIKKEIKIISQLKKVRLVICGGTFKYAKRIFSPVTIKPLEKSGAHYFVYNNIIFVEFIHPSQRGAAADKRITYAYAKEVFSELPSTQAQG